MDAQQLGMSPIDLRDEVGARIKAISASGKEPSPILILAFARLDQEVKFAEARLEGVDEATRWRYEWNQSHRRAA